MNPRIIKINSEIEKMQSRISEWQSRIKELERQRTEIENSEIVGLVRSINATPEELMALLENIRKNGVVSHAHE